MANLRRQAARTLAEAIQAKCRLAQPVTSISAPPSGVGETPSVAIWLEKFNTNWYDDEEVQVNSAGQVKIGALADFVPEPGARIDGGAFLSKIGVIQATGRIWVGCRLAPLREEIEDKIFRMFCDDDVAGGRLMLRIENPVVDGYLMPWSWPFAVFCDDSEWDAEYAFSERQWSWLHIELCLDVLVARSSPRIDVNCGGFQIAVDMHFQQPYDDTGVLDLDDGADDEIFQLKPDGVLDPIPA